MPTGSKSVMMNAKQLLGFQDLSVRGLTALRNSHIEATQARWDVDGVFNAKLTIGGASANTLQVNGSSKATDGLGHILNIAAAYRITAAFQNTNAITYYVGLMYAEVPAGIRLNPSSGQPQFDSFVEEVGYQAAPNSVVDNGNGTITMVIDSATEGGVSNAGRTVRVWKVVPADGATTFAIALEEVTSVFTSGSNKITTAGKFGQTTVSTVAADYLVTVMGPRVSRGTDLSAVSGVAFVGTIVGNGGTPTAGDNTNQTLLKTFQDASQVTYTPSGWLSPGATNVQLALDAVVTGLGSSVSTSSSGAAKVGAYATAYDTIAAGGIGSTADSVYSGAAKVSDVLIGINAASKRRQTFQTKNDANGSSQLADDNASVDLANQVSTSRPQWLRALAVASSAPYTISADVPAGAGQGSYFMGEFNDPTQANPHLRKTAIKVTGANRAISLGKWQRIWLDAAAGFAARFGGTSNIQAGILEDFGINGGILWMDVNNTPTAVDGPLNWRNGVIKPKPSESKWGAASIVYGNSNNGWVWNVMEKLLVYGNDPTQSGGARFGAVQFTFHLDAPLAAATVSAQGRPLVYRDCVFVCQDTGSNGLVTVEGTQLVTFENCKFFDISGRTISNALFQVNAVGAQVRLKNCAFFCPEGFCFNSLQSAGVLLEDCTFVAGVGGTNALSSPQVLTINGGDPPQPPTVRDCRVYLGNGVFRTSGAPAALVGFYGTTVNAYNLSIKVDSGATNLGWARLFDIQVNSQSGQGCMAVFDNVTLDLSSVVMAASSPNPPIFMAANASADSSRLVVDRFLMRNTQTTTSSVRPWIQIGSGVSARDWMLVASVAACANKVGALLLILGDNNIFRDIKIGRARYAMCTTQGTVLMSGNNNKFVGLKGDEAFNTTGLGTATASVFVLSGNHNHVSELDVTCGADSSSILYVDGRDNVVTHCNLVAITNTTQIPCRFVSGRRNRYVNNNMHYNGTSNFGLEMASSDSIVDDATFYRSAGAIAAYTNTGSGNQIGTCVVTSTTL